MKEPTHIILKDVKSYSRDKRTKKDIYYAIKGDRVIFVKKWDNSLCVVINPKGEKIFVNINNIKPIK